MRGSSWWFNERKNCVMSKANVLVILFLTQPEQIKWVRATPVSDIDLCLRLPNWLGWIKLFKIEWNWSRSPITFLISFPMVLRRTIGLNVLEELYASLLDFGITINEEILKWEGQWPNSKHVLAMLMIYFRHNLFLKMILGYFHDNLSGLEVDKLLYLVIELVSSFSENGAQFDEHLLVISSNISILICLFWAILNNEWRAIYRFSISRQCWPLCLIVSTSGSLHLFTQFINSHRCYDLKSLE